MRRIDIGIDGRMPFMGDSLLRTGPPSSTFEWDDLARIVLQRPMWGLSSTCEVTYFISRYPDEAVWDEEIPCREEG